MLGITMIEVREDHAKNTTICKKFFNIPDVRRMIAVRQLLCIGKVIRNSMEQIPSKLLACWIQHKRKPGDVLFNNRKSIVKNLQLLIPSADKVGPLKTWAFHAIDEKHWIKLIKAFRITSKNFIPLSPPRRNIPPPLSPSPPPIPPSP